MKVKIRVKNGVRYYNCRDCGAPLPPDRRELGFCEFCWRPFTQSGNSKQRRELLGKSNV